MDQSPDQSPNAMAEAAFTAAVAQMERQDKNNKQNPKEIDSDRENDSITCADDGVAIISRPAKLLKVHGDGIFSEASQNNDVCVRGEDDASARIEEIWKSSANKTETKFVETLQLLVGEFDSLVQCGLGAFYDLDTTSRQLTQSKELAETRTREAQRLHTIDEQSRASLSNLLRAVESSKAEARDSSRSAQVEARLRTDINSLRDERDRAVTEGSDNRRKLSLLEEELRLTKSKLSRVMQEKISMERDSRAAISLARSLDNNNSNDMNYYKRKVSELSDKLQMQQDLISKQMNTISQLRGQSGSTSSNKRKSY